MTELADKRLLGDFKQLMQQRSTGFVASPFKESVRKWAAIILGPEETEWAGAVLCLSLEFTTDYPTRSPNVKFITRMFHPNVY